MEPIPSDKRVANRGLPVGCLVPLLLIVGGYVAGATIGVVGLVALYAGLCAGACVVGISLSTGGYRHRAGRRLPRGLSVVAGVAMLALALLSGWMGAALSIDLLVMPPRVEVTAIVAVKPPAGRFHPVAEIETPDGAWREAPANAAPHPGPARLLFGQLSGTLLSIEQP